LGFGQKFDLPLHGFLTVLGCGDGQFTARGHFLPLKPFENAL